MTRAFEHRPIRVSKRNLVHDGIGAANRMLRILGDRSLAEVLLGLTILELWICLITFVVWLSLGSYSAEVDWNCRGLLVIGVLCGVVTGACGACAWRFEREIQPHRDRSSTWKEW